ncbi:uncharacterized protein [Musca autumnalis]|uniref:uncharacterized protein n=1 Tax=Musca autumnalis TaxID=221902 RepID=UPI003CECD3F1
MANADNKVEEKKLPIVIGVSTLNIIISVTEDIPMAIDGAMCRAKSTQYPGGVGRNLAEVIYKLYGEVNFFSLIGNDTIGEILYQLTPDLLESCIYKFQPSCRTPSSTVIVDKKGDCKLIVNDEGNIDPSDWEIGRMRFHQASVIIIDANTPVAHIRWILANAHSQKVPVFYEPADLKVSGKAFYNFIPLFTNTIRLTTPNYAELQDIVKSEWEQYYKFNTVDLNNIEETLESVKSMLKAISHMFDCVVVTLGPNGIVLSLNASVDPYRQSLFRNQKYIFDPTERAEIQKKIIFFPTPYVVEDVVSVSGVGDNFAGGFISGLLKEYTVTQSIALGFYAAKRALKTAAAVPEEYFPPGQESEMWQRQLNEYKIPGEPERYKSAR